MPLDYLTFILKVTECCLVNTKMEKPGITFGNRLVCQCNSTPGKKGLGYYTCVNSHYKLVFKFNYWINNLWSFVFVYRGYCEVLWNKEEVVPAVTPWKQEEGSDVATEGWSSSTIGFFHSRNTWSTSEPISGSWAWAQATFLGDHGSSSLFEWWTLDILLVTVAICGAVSGPHKGQSPWFRVGRRDKLSALMCCFPGRCWISKSYSSRRWSQRAICPWGALKEVSHRSEWWPLPKQIFRPSK